MPSNGGLVAGILRGSGAPLLDEPPSVVVNEGNSVPCGLLGGGGQRALPSRDRPDPVHDRIPGAAVSARPSGRPGR